MLHCTSILLWNYCCERVLLFVVAVFWLSLGLLKFGVVVDSRLEPLGGLTPVHVLDEQHVQHVPGLPGGRGQMHDLRVGARELSKLPTEVSLDEEPLIPPEVQVVGEEPSER